MVIAVVGAGSVGRRHAANLEVLGRAAELIPWRGFDRAALEKRADVEALVIATATPIRTELVALAVEKDWPVYVEKPLAATPEEVAAILALAGPIAARSLLGTMMRYHPVIRALHDDGLSDVYDFAFEIGHDVRQWRQNWRFADSYAADPAGGGVLLDLCHEIDMAACLFPGLGVASVESIGHPEFPGIDFASRIALSREGGPAGSVAMDYLAPVSWRRMVLKGLTRVVEADLLAAEIRPLGDAPRRFDYDRNAMFLGAMGDFLALADGRETSGNPLMPRLDRVGESAALVAEARAQRRFVGNVALDMG